jgi:hypothetical protein
VSLIAVSLEQLIPLAFFIFSPTFFGKLVVKMCSMVERTDTGWLTVLEKKGLHQATGILENYGIDSETDADYIELSMQSQFNKRVM